MAGFEVVVRPVVLPNIRPKPAQTLPPAADPDKGWCEIKGNPAKQVDLTSSWSTSMSKSHQVEMKRRVDEVRTYQENDDGTVNKENFVDTEVANKIWTRGGKKPALDGSTPGGDGAITGSSTPKGNSTEIATWYAKQLEQQNIEIRKRNQIKTNPDAQGE
jgi:hypothetical protein